jgi:hypothetical protein
MYEPTALPGLQTCRLSTQPPEGAVILATPVESASLNVRTAIGVLLLALLPSTSFAQAQSLLEQAQRDLQNLEYGDAMRSLDAALKQPNNNRATVLKVLEIQALTLAAMGQAPRAVKAFQTLLTLQSDFKLVGDHAPRITTAFYEARSWVDRNGAVESVPQPPLVAGAVVTGVRLELINDPMKLVKEVRFHLLEDGQPVVVDVPVTQNKTVTALTKATKVVWWAELLGERKSTLLEAVEAVAPRVEVTAQPETAAPPAPEEITQAEPSRPTSSGRVASFVLVGAGAAALGVGAIFGIQANALVSKIDAATDPTGRVNGISQREGQVIDGQQRTQATLANVFLITGAALAAGGVTLFVLSREDASVVMVPTGTGAALAGTFP